MAIKWKDKKDITLLSTIHTDNLVEVETATRNKIKPKVIADYNHTMGDIDKMDQNLENYYVPRKGTKKYYKKVFFHHLIWRYGMHISVTRCLN